MIGQELSHFRITAKLGEGGMGAVYRAEDTKLGREVAIKVLPEEFTANTDRLARFEREARALAALNHPNIAGIYEVGEAETGLHYLVMELAEGEDLAARLSRGSIPADEALPLALQIAGALEAAHEKGIVHRDLKPSNLMVSPEGQIKVLDFGLAKAWQDDAAAAGTNLTHSPTLTAQMTTAGIILGTAAYMSPEQARGQEADQRSDIWSFGAVLYEMLAGRGLFKEPTMSDTLAAVLRADIDWDELPEETPAAVQRLLRRSLERDPKQRLHSVADARLELQEAASGSATESETAAVAATSTRAGRLLPAVAILLALGLVALGGVAWRLAGRTQPVIRSLVSPPQGGAFYLESGAAGPVAVSPDGARMAFTARDAAGTPSLWIRDLDDPDPRVLPGTEGAMFPFWSPDSQTVAFTTDAENKLYRIDIAGGPPRLLCDDAGGGKGGTWGEEGVIIFGRSGGPLHRADASGEKCEPLTALDPAFPDEVGHRLPRFLPDGQRFLYLANRAAAADTDNRIMIGSLDGTPPRELMRSSSQVEMVADHLWFVDQGTLVARPFDPGRELITGEARPIAEGVGELRGPGIGLFSVSQSGVLAFHGLDAAEKRSITWRDRSGRSLGTLGLPDRHINAVLSPDGKQAAVLAYEEFGFLSTYLYDVATEISTRFTFGEPYKMWAIWSPSGDRIAVTWLSGKAIETLPVFTGTDGEVLWKAEAGEDLSLLAQDWSPDGSLLLAGERYPGEDGQHDLWVLPLDTERAPYPLTETPFNEWDPALSPDGRWMAYVSDESGQYEAYVTSFPDRGRKWQLSIDGGESPQWSQRGDELFYLDLDDVLMAVPVNFEGGSFVHGSGSALFQTRLARGSFSVSPDGDRFLIVEREERAAPSHINLLVGWQQLLERRSDP